MKTAKPALVIRIINPVRIRVYDWRAEAKKLKVAERNKSEKKGQGRSEECDPPVRNQEDM